MRKTSIITDFCVVLLMTLFYLSGNSVFGNFKKNADTSIAININVKKPQLKIPDNFLGLSYEADALTDTLFFKKNHKALINLMNGLGKGIIRLGGYYVDNHYWSGHRRNNMNRDSIATSDIDSLISFVHNTNWKIILGLNFVKPEHNLEEANYVWSHGRDVISTFEIGNEPETYHKLFRPNSYSTQDYIKEFVGESNILLNNLKGIPIAGPATSLPDNYIEPFISANPGIKLITAHLYPCGESKTPGSIYKLLDNKYIDQTNEICKKLNSETSLHGDVYRISECNNFYDEGTNISDRFASTLWGIDFMFTLAQNNCQGVNFHGGGRGFTPITIKRGTPISPRPLYYAMLFFHLASKGKLLPLTIEKNNVNIKAYAVLQNDNKLAVTIINKGLNSDTKIKLSNAQFKNAQITVLKSPTIFSKDSITLGGAKINEFGKWLPAKTDKLYNKNGMFQISVQKASAALIILSN